MLSIVSEFPAALYRFPAMSRLSDRAFQLIKTEIDRCYGDSPEDQLERVIMLARLENLNQQSGDPVSKVQLWEEFSDISPNFDPKVLQLAANANTTPPFVGTSMGVGAVAVLVAAAIGVENLNTAIAPTRELAEPNLSTKNVSNNQAKTAVSATQPLAPSPSAATAPQFASTGKNTQPIVAASDITASNKSAFDTAKAFGWQAALKSQNPPHSVQHWQETATLWTQAIDLLDQVPRRNQNYAAAQAKKEVYQQNLKAIQAREQAAIAREATVTTTPKFSAPTESEISVAKRYGWQAAIASQNAPHPAQKWADISQLWQLAIQNLNKIDTQDPNYADAQKIKAQYQANLAAIRQRYQQEQNATQRLQSLQATLNEIEQSITLSNTSKQAQLNAIITRLQTIPSNTLAHLQAQSLIERTQIQLSGIPDAPSARLAVSTEVTN